MQIRLLALACLLVAAPAFGADDPSAATEAPAEPTEAERERAQREKDSRDGEAVIRGFYAAIAGGDLEVARGFLLPSAWDEARFHEEWVLEAKSLELRRVYVGGRDMEGILYGTVDHCREVRAGEFHAWAGGVKLEPFEGGWRIQGWDRNTVPWSIGDFCPAQDRQGRMLGSLSGDEAALTGSLESGDLSEAFESLGAGTARDDGGATETLSSRAELATTWRATCKDCRDELSRAWEELGTQIGWCATVSLMRAPRPSAWVKAKFRVTEGQTASVVVKADVDGLADCAERKILAWTLPGAGDYTVRGLRWTMTP